MSISTLAARNGLDGQTLRKQYKEKISGYRNWDQLGGMPGNTFSLRTTSEKT